MRREGKKEGTREEGMEGDKRWERKKKMRMVKGSGDGKERGEDDDTEKKGVNPSFSY